MISKLPPRYLPFLVFSLFLLFPGSCRTWSSREERAAQAYNEGNSMREAGRLENAEAAYRTALGHEPDMAAAVYNLALTLVDLGRADEALDLLQDLNQQDPNNLKVLRAMGWAAWKDGRPNAALDYYLSVLIIFPGDQEALRGASDVYEAIGRPADSVEYRSLLVNLDENPESLMDLARTLTMAERYEEALTVFQEVLIRNPADSEALNGASIAAEEAGLFRDALEFRLRSVDSTSDPGEVWWHVARLLLVEIGDYEGGLEALELAMAEGFSDDEALQELISNSPPAVQPAARAIVDNADAD